MNTNTGANTSSSFTEYKHALELFRDRYHLIRLFSTYLHEPTQTNNIIFFSGEGGNGKSLLLRFLQEHCCKLLLENGWEFIKKLSDEEFTSNLIDAENTEKIPFASLEFGAQPFIDGDSKDCFSALILLRKQLNKFGLKFPYYDFAVIWYLYRSGNLSSDKLKVFLPKEEVDLAGSIADTLYNTSWGTLVISALKVIDKGLAEKATIYWRSFNLDPSKVEEIRERHPEKELIPHLPILFADDLISSVSNQKTKKTVLFFDEHEAFWGDQNNLSDEHYFQRDEWFRRLVNRLMSQPCIVIAVSGRNAPRWSEAVRRDSVIKTSQLNIQPIGGLPEADSRSYLELLDIKDPVKQGVLVDYARINENEIHPFLLGLSADVALAAQSQNIEITQENFPNTSQENNKPKELLSRLLRYVDNDTKYAIDALSACRSFDLQIYLMLGKELSLGLTLPKFYQLVKFSFVWSMDRIQEGQFSIHQLVRRLNYENRNSTTLKAHIILEKFYREKENIPEAIYHKNRQNWLSGVTEWVEVFDKTLRLSLYEESRTLLEIRQVLLIQDSFALGRVLEAEGNYFLTLARYGEAKDKYQQAISAYDKALDQEPTQAQIYSNKGVILKNLARLEETLSNYDGALENYEKAVEAFNTSISIDPNLATAYNNKGLALQHLGSLQVNQTRYEQARDSFNRSIEALDKAISLQDGLMEAHNNKGNTFWSLGGLLTQLSEYDEAGNVYQQSLLSYDRAIELSPDWPQLYSNKAALLEAMAKLKKELSMYDEASEKLDEAINLCDYALSIAPNDITIYGNKALSLFNKGELLFWKGEYQQALDYCNKALGVYETALSIAPNYVEAHNNKGFILKLIGDIHGQLSNLEDAMKCYQYSLSAYDRVLQLSPNDLWVQGNKGDIFFKQAEMHINLSGPEQAIESFLESIKVYDQSLSLFPNSVGILNGKGLALKELGNLYLKLTRFEAAKANLQSAVETFKLALAISKDNVSAYNNLGLAFQILAELRSVLAEYEEAVQTYELAISAYDKALGLAPNFVHILYNKAITLVRKGELQVELSENNEALNSYDSAIDFCDKALTVAPDCLPALSNKAVALSLKARLQKQSGLPNESLNNHRLAVDILDRVLKVVPSAGDIYSNKGNELSAIAELYDFLGDTEEAVKTYKESLVAFDKSLAYESSNSAALSGKATTLANYGFFRGKSNHYLEGKGKIEEAISIIDKSINLAPSDPRFHFNKAQILISCGNLHKLFSEYMKALYSYEEAIKHFNKALEVAPKSMRVLNSKVFTTQKTVEVLFGLINSPPAYYLRESLLFKGDIYCTDAINMYSNMLKHAPNDAMILRSKAYMLFYLGQLKALRESRGEAEKNYKYCLTIVKDLLKLHSADDQLKKLKRDIYFCLDQLKR